MGTWEHFFQPIFEFSGFSADFLISKMAKIRVFKGPPPLIFPRKPPISAYSCHSCHACNGCMVAWYNADAADSWQFRKNLWERGNMGTWEHFFQPIFEFSGISADFLISKMAKIRVFKGPPL